MQYAIARSYDLFINNAWHRSSSNEVLEVRSPLTDELLCTVPNASERDVVEAVMAAKAAWPAWHGLGVRKRAEAIFALADKLMHESERIAWLETANTGKPWRESKANVSTAADRLRYFASVARALEGSVLPDSGNILSYDIREPLGVIGVIGAWNFRSICLSARSPRQSPPATRSSTSPLTRRPSRHWRLRASLRKRCRPASSMSLPGPAT
jgi:acyl-CoA reductase-like NAD-dependent aldehyde dehydrogenase